MILLFYFFKLEMLNIGGHQANPPVVTTLVNICCLLQYHKKNLFRNELRNWTGMKVYLPTGQPK